MTLCQRNLQLLNNIDNLIEKKKIIIDFLYLYRSIKNL